MMSNTNSYVSILFTSLLLSFHSFHSQAAFHTHAATALLLTVLTLLSLSLAATDHKRVQSEARLALISRAVTGLTGFLASVQLFCLPLQLSNDVHPIAQTSLRIPAFFYACKILDLVLASEPPLLLPLRDGSSSGLSTAQYMWRVFSETRYASFANLAVNDTALRNRDTPLRNQLLWTWAPVVVLPLATWCSPHYLQTELKVLTGLALLQIALEGLHSLLHPRCANPLFRQPFAATSLAEFWGRRWHFGAYRFLHGLGYAPARAVVGRWTGRAELGRAAGVVAAFALSGAWHAWCGVVLTRDEYAVRQALGLWAVFVLQGVGIVVERWALSGSEGKKWKRGWRAMVVAALGWVYSVKTASIWFRYAEATAKIPPPWMDA